MAILRKNAAGGDENCPAWAKDFKFNGFGGFGTCVQSSSLEDLNRGSVPVGNETGIKSAPGTPLSPRRKFSNDDSITRDRSASVGSPNRPGFSGDTQHVVSSWASVARGTASRVSNGSTGSLISSGSRGGSQGGLSPEHAQQLADTVAAHQKKISKNGGDDPPT